MSLFLSVIVRVFSAVCNTRTAVGLVANFFKNFSLVLLWLTVFKNANLIPIEWRPPIDVTIVRDWDTFIFTGVSGVFCGIVLVLISYPIACHLILTAPRNRRLVEGKDCEYGFVDIAEESQPNSPMLNSPSTRRSVSMTDSVSHSTEPSPSSSSPLPSSPSSGLRLLSQVVLSFSPTSIAACCIWVALNLAHALIYTILPPLDILAWLSYVIGHLAAPIVTAVYLWLFAPPGAMGCFSLALGLQNLAGVSTHLLFPTAPPWYNHMYGERPGNYSIPGYAAGLTRVDFALGTHIHSQGFHMSPIVFGAFPSLHSAFVSLIFLFVSRYSTWGGRAGWKLIVKDWRSFGKWPIALGTLLAITFMFWQWWSTMYLDHHYRVDLLGGSVYAVVAFYIMLPKLQRAEARYEQGRGVVTTGGMRLFEGTWFADFFDPLPQSSDNGLAMETYSPLHNQHLDETAN